MVRGRVRDHFMQPEDYLGSAGICFLWLKISMFPALILTSLVEDRRSLLPFVAQVMQVNGSCEEQVQRFIRTNEFACGGESHMAMICARVEIRKSVCPGSAWGARYPEFSQARFCTLKCNSPIVPRAFQHH